MCMWRYIVAHRIATFEYFIHGLKIFSPKYFLNISSSLLNMVNYEHRHFHFFLHRKYATFSFPFKCQWLCQQNLWFKKKTRTAFIMSISDSILLKVSTVSRLAPANSCWRTYFATSGASMAMSLVTKGRLRISLATTSIPRRYRKRRLQLLMQVL